MTDRTAEEVVVGVEAEVFEPPTADDPSTGSLNSSHPCDSTRLV